MKRTPLSRIVWPCALASIAAAAAWAARLGEAPHLLMAGVAAAVSTVLALVVAQAMRFDRFILARAPRPGSTALTRDIVHCAGCAHRRGLAALGRPWHRPRHPLLRFALDLARQGLDPRLVRGAVTDRCLISSNDPTLSDDTRADDSTRPWRQVLRGELGGACGLTAIAAGAVILLLVGPTGVQPAVGLVAMVLVQGGMVTISCQFLHVREHVCQDAAARLLTAEIVSVGAAAIASGIPPEQIERTILELVASGGPERPLTSKAA